MRVPGLEEVLQRLREAGDARHGRGAEEREVAEVEQGLGLSLPPGYRSFLLQVGWASVGGIAVFGLGEGVPSDLDLGTVVATARRQGLPRNLVPFSRDEDRAIYCLDATHSGPYESSVSRWHPGASADDALEYAGHDFASWLWMRLAERT
jgi:hypothetical protein